MMLGSARLALLALLRGLRFIGNTLKHFVLRCLLFWPHVLCSLRHIWPSCPRTSPKDIPKNKDLGGQARPSFPGASGCERYRIIYASRDPNRSSEPDLPLGSGSTEVWPLGPIVGQSQSAPPNPASSFGPSLLDSPHHSGRYSHGDSTSFTANADDVQLPSIPHIGPLTVTHSRVTSTHFSRAPHRSRSPSPMPHSHSFPQSTTLEGAAASPSSGHSRPPSPPPSLFPCPHSLPQSSELDSAGNTQIPDVVISLETAEADSFPPSPVSFQGGYLSQFTTAGTEHLTLDLAHPGSLGLTGDARHSTESLRLNTFVPPPNQARLSFPSPSFRLEIPTINDTGNWSDGSRRSIVLMHSEQVSRYKSDV